MKWIIPVSCVLLAGISIVTLRSIAPDLMQRQSLYFLIGFALFALVNAVSYLKLLKFSGLFYFLLIVSLVLLLLIGSTTRSTVRWIDLFGGFKIQPSQFAPIIVSLFLSSQWLQIIVKGWRSFLRYFLIVLTPVGLVFLQPDFGTSLVLLISFLSLMIFLNISKKQLFVFSLIGSLLMIGVWGIMLKPYQRARITNFFVGSETEKAASYNARQALIAVGSGGLYGRGLGAGVQSHLKFLPERQTDFVFASIAEEWGFVGSLLIILVYSSFFFVLLYYLFQVNDSSKKVVILVLLTNLFLQVVINIGMNMGLLPITGLTLPLLSYGGSSVISFLLHFGIAFKIINQRHPEAKLRIC